MVSTVDTDVVVILLGVVALLTTLAYAFELWVEFGKGKTLRYTLFIIRLGRILQ